jgi:hypothetical protein
VLRTERIVHIALQRDIRFNRETGKRSRVHHLAPDVFARWNGLEDAIPTAVEIKIDMFKTRIGSCQGRRERNHFRDFF